tara:strand:- start:582 stop:1085 length:504 start_codon:yes stop_codon:yes gene_type:complete
MVEYAKSQRLKSLPKFVILFMVLASIFLMAHYTGLTRTYCGTDISCFMEKAKICKPVEVYSTQNNNIYHYKILSTPTNNCILKIKLEKVREGTLPEHKQLLEGKSMKCTVQKNQLETLNLQNLNEIMPHCSGPLKESIYELIIKRMYELIISNLGEIAEKAENILQI